VTAVKNRKNRPHTSVPASAARCVDGTDRKNVDVRLDAKAQVPFAETRRMETISPEKNASLPQRDGRWRRNGAIHRHRLPGERFAAKMAEPDFGGSTPILRPTNPLYANGKKIAPKSQCQNTGRSQNARIAAWFSTLRPLHMKSWNGDKVDQVSFSVPLWRP